jgi:hypothetical protein
MERNICYERFILSGRQLLQVQAVLKEPDLIVRRLSFLCRLLTQEPGLVPSMLFRTLHQPGPSPQKLRAPAHDNVNSPAHEIKPATAPMH